MTKTLTTNCRLCDKEFTYTQKRGRQPLYCSHSHRQISYINRMQNTSKKLRDPQTKLKIKDIITQNTSLLPEEVEDLTQKILEEVR